MNYDVKEFDINELNDEILIYILRFLSYFFGFSVKSYADILKNNMFSSFFQWLALNLHECKTLFMLIIKLNITQFELFCAMFSILVD